MPTIERTRWDDIAEAVRGRARSLKPGEYVHLSTIDGAETDIEIDVTEMTHDRVWVYFQTKDAGLADALTRQHLDHDIIDTESLAFSCYDEGCNLSVRWVG